MGIPFDFAQGREPVERLPIFMQGRDGETTNERPLQNFGCRPNSLSGFGSKSSKYSNIPAASILALLDFVSVSYVFNGLK